MSEEGFETLEWLYDELARRLDVRDPGRREIYLAKLVLLMANELADRDAIAELLERAGAGEDSGGGAPGRGGPAS